MRQGMGSHQSASMGKNEWLTPPLIIKALGEFDLDPCAPAVRPWNTARLHYSRSDNGLTKEWTGRVWLNPPYGQQTGLWLNKLKKHGDGIALIFARTETKMFFDYCWCADALLFLLNRLYFYHVDGTRASANAGAPSVLVAYGDKNVRALKECRIEGKFLEL
jgi:DNA N-6-adenine-methyltransferase (Dam)